MVSRNMDVQEGLKACASVGTASLCLDFWHSETERAHEIEWYQELAEISEDPLVALQLAILQAEAGHISQALLSAHKWAGARISLPQFAD